MKLLKFYSIISFKAVTSILIPVLENARGVTETPGSIRNSEKFGLHRDVHPQIKQNNYLFITFAGPL